MNSDAVRTRSSTVLLAQVAGKAFQLLGGVPHQPGDLRRVAVETVGGGLGGIRDVGGELGAEGDL